MRTKDARIITAGIIIVTNIDVSVVLPPFVIILRIMASPDKAGKNLYVQAIPV